MKIRKSTHGLSALCVAMALTACGKKDKDDESSKSGATDKISGAYGVVKTVDDALSSTSSTAPGTLIIPPVTLGISKMGSNKICSEHGQPVKPTVTKAAGEVLSDDDFLSSSEKDYAAELFYCLASLKTDSPETIRGSLAQFKSVLCSFEKALGKSIEYTEAGNNLISGDEDLKVALTSECWPQGTPEGMTEVTITTAVATKLDESTGYQYKLVFSGGEVNYNLQFFNADGRVGFKKIGDGDGDGAGDMTEITLDSNTGSVLLNIVDDREGAGKADSAYRRVVRMKIKGEFDKETIAFKSITGLQGLYFNSADYKANPNSFSGTTINGDATIGFAAHSAQGEVGGTMQEQFKGCTGEKSDCTASPLLIDATTSAFFSHRPEWKVQKTSGMPICDNGQSIDFGATMSSGKLGKCE